MSDKQNAFENPAGAAMKRLGRRTTLNRTRNRESSDCSSDGSSVARSQYSRTSRRSVSVIQTKDDVDLFESLNVSTSVKLRNKKGKIFNEPSTLSKAEASSPVTDIVEGALNIVRSMSPVSQGSVEETMSGPYTPGLPDSLKNHLDLRNNDNSFHVLASLLVEFFLSRVEKKILTLQPEDRLTLERFLPESARDPFVDAVRYRLALTPIAPRNPLHFLTIQCQELGLDLEGEKNPIFTAHKMTDEPLILTVLNVLDSDDSSEMLGEIIEENTGSSETTADVVVASTTADVSRSENDSDDDSTSEESSDNLYIGLSDGTFSDENIGIDEVVSSLFESFSEAIIKSFDTSVARDPQQSPKGRRFTIIEEREAPATTDKSTPAPNKNNKSKDIPSTDSMEGGSDNSTINVKDEHCNVTSSKLPVKFDAEGQNAFCLRADQNSFSFDGKQLAVEDESETPVTKDGDSQIVEISLETTDANQTHPEVEEVLPRIMSIDRSSVCLESICEPMDGEVTASEEFGNACTRLDENVVNEEIPTQIEKQSEMDAALHNQHGPGHGSQQLEKQFDMDAALHNQQVPGFGYQQLEKQSEIDAPLLNQDGPGCGSQQLEKQSEMETGLHSQHGPGVVGSQQLEKPSEEDTSVHKQHSPEFGSKQLETPSEIDTSLHNKDGPGIGSQQLKKPSEIDAALHNQHGPGFGSQPKPECDMIENVEREKIDSRALNEHQFETSSATESGTNKYNAPLLLNPVLTSHNDQMELLQSKEVRRCSSDPTPEPALRIDFMKTEGVTPAVAPPLPTDQPVQSTATLADFPSDELPGNVGISSRRRPAHIGFVNQEEEYDKTNRRGYSSDKPSPFFFPSHSTIEWFSSLFSSSIQTSLETCDCTSRAYHDNETSKKRRPDVNLPISDFSPSPSYDQQGLGNHVLYPMEMETDDIHTEPNLPTRFLGDSDIIGTKNRERDRRLLTPSHRNSEMFHDVDIMESGAPESLEARQLMIEFREASILMEQSENPETADFWRNHVFDLQSRITTLQEKITTNPDPNGVMKSSVNILETNRRLIKEFKQREQKEAPMVTHWENDEKNMPEITQTDYQLPMVDVIAPADLPGGYRFEAEIEGQRFVATVPAGGVRQGEAFTCYMSELDSVGIDIPVGYWKDDFSKSCKYGFCHGVVVNSFFCPLLILGQIQFRTKLDFLGRPRLLSHGITIRSTMISVIAFWTATNLLLFGASNLKWSRGLELTVADVLAFALINFCMIGFVVFVTQSTRSSLREKFMIREERCFDFEDLCCAVWCLPCTLCQMARHTANYDDYEVVSCSKTGLPDGVRVNDVLMKENGYFV